MNFADLGLSEELLQAVESAGYTEPTAIQERAVTSAIWVRPTR